MYIGGETYVDRWTDGQTDIPTNTHVSLSSYRFARIKAQHNDNIYIYIGIINIIMTIMIRIIIVVIIIRIIIIIIIIIMRMIIVRMIAVVIVILIMTIVSPHSWELRAYRCDPVNRPA